MSDGKFLMKHLGKTIKISLVDMTDKDGWDILNELRNTMTDDTFRQLKFKVYGEYIEIFE